VVGPRFCFGGQPVSVARWGGIWEMGKGKLLPAPKNGSPWAGTSFREKKTPKKKKGCRGLALVADRGEKKKGGPRPPGHSGRFLFLSAVSFPGGCGQNEQKTTFAGIHSRTCGGEGAGIPIIHEFFEPQAKRQKKKKPLGAGNWAVFRGRTFATEILNLLFFNFKNGTGLMIEYSFPSFCGTWGFLGGTQKKPRFWGGRMRSVVGNCPGGALGFFGGLGKREKPLHGKGGHLQFLGGQTAAGPAPRRKNTGQKSGANVSRFKTGQAGNGGGLLRKSSTPSCPPPSGPRISCPGIPESNTHHAAKKRFLLVTRFRLAGNPKKTSPRKTGCRSVFTGGNGWEPTRFFGMEGGWAAFGWLPRFPVAKIGAFCPNFGAGNGKFGPGTEFSGAQKPIDFSGYKETRRKNPVIRSTIFTFLGWGPHPFRRGPIWGIRGGVGHPVWSRWENKSGLCFPRLPSPQQKTWFQIRGPNVWVRCREKKWIKKNDGRRGGRGGPKAGTPGCWCIV